MVKVFTKPNCRDCESTKRWLKAKNVEYTEVQLTDTVRDELLAEGWARMPVVKVGDVAWSGFSRVALEKNLGGN